MPNPRWCGGLAVLVVASLAPGLGSPARGESVRVTLKDGAVYLGERDTDNTITTIFDELRRIIFRTSKIARVESEPGHRAEERFRLKQPLEVHGGSMPGSALGIVADAWDSYGRRRFRYLRPAAPQPQKVEMTQAINELGPKITRYRGITGFWLGQVATDQVPRKVVLGLLANVDPTNQSERLRVCRFLIQAEWYAEALVELDRLAADFPDLKETVEGVRAAIRDLEVRQQLDQVAVCRVAQQPRRARTLLRRFPTEGVAQELLESVREQLRRDEAQAAEDRRLARDLQALADRLPTEERQGGWIGPLIEVLRGLGAVPDAVRDRFEPYLAAAGSEGPSSEGLFALAMSGWVVGPDAAVSDLSSAKALWKARAAAQDYLASQSASERLAALTTLADVEIIDPQTHSTSKLDPKTLTRIVRRLPPPLADSFDHPGQTRIYRVADDASEVPTEYSVLLPPEYHPLRSYPAIVALHDGRGPQSALDWWGPEAARRGFIVIAPEYNLPNQPPGYTYTPTEHAAVELALRDARKRLAIDADRVFLAGVLNGGDMAWDFGLAHPDLFAGVVCISGLPGKYVFRTKSHAERLPLYIALGDLVPAGQKIVFEMVKGLIEKTYDVTYIEYYRRGLEDLPEEAAPALSWMSHRRRDPYPSEFSALSARSCDDRFYGVVLRELADGRATTAVTADPLGQDLHPATIDYKVRNLANRVDVLVTGIRRMDVWVSPEQVDFSRKLEVRINGKAYYKDIPQPDFGPMLEDLRLRGDRRQLYWLKVSAG